MVYDRILKKGVKRRYVPPPMIFSFSGNATCMDVIQKGIEKFFSEVQSPDALNFCLADSSGIPYERNDTWSLSEFIQATGQPPSKLRLYVMNVDEVI